MTSNSTGDDANDQDHRHAARSAASTVVGKRRRATALRWSLVGFAVLVLVGVVAGLWLAGRTNATDAAIIGTAPHYRLVDQNGKPVSSQDLAGKVQIVTALFPYCTEFCPLVAANLVEFRDNVVRNSDMKGHVVFVFFNVAPADAGPAALRTFLKQYG